jgi:hypothetical protein
MPNIFIYNHNTGEAITREMTDEELEHWQIDENARLAEIAQRNEAQELLRQNKISAYQKLGLNDDEIEALLPTEKESI